MLVVDFRAFQAAEKGGEGRPTGLTKDSGFQVGSRRTYAISPTEAWSLVTSERAGELLTGRRAALSSEGPGAAGDGPPVAYEITTFVPLSHVRMKWRPAEWPTPSILQVRILPGSAGRTCIAFHQERLPDAAAREAMLGRWEAVHARFAELVAEGKGGMK